MFASVWVFNWDLFKALNTLYNQRTVSHLYEQNKKWKKKKKRFPELETVEGLQPTAVITSKMMNTEGRLWRRQTTAKLLSEGKMKVIMR